MAIVEKQGIFRGEEIQHVFSGLVVRDAVAAELKMSKGYDFVWIVSDGVFEDDFEAEFPFLFYPVKFKKIQKVFFCVCQSIFRQMFIAHKGSFYPLPHPIHAKFACVYLVVMGKNDDEIEVWDAVAVFIFAQKPSVDPEILCHHVQRNGTDELQVSREVVKHID
jgi:hypothetical protein